LALRGIPSAALRCTSVRNQNPLEVRPGAIKYPYIADAMHQRAAGAFGESREESVPGVAIAARAFYLNELMVK
jgi:hypothetical protein